MGQVLVFRGFESEPAAIDGDEPDGFEVIADVVTSGPGEAADAKGGAVDGVAAFAALIGCAGAQVIAAVGAGKGVGVGERGGRSLNGFPHREILATASGRCR